MAVKVSSNLKAMEHVMTEFITVERLRGWATAGILAAGEGYQGDSGKRQPFEKLVTEKYLNDPAVLGRSKETAWWKRNKDFHHADAFGMYAVPERRAKQAEVHFGIYGSVLGLGSKLGMTANPGSLNYLASRKRMATYRGQRVLMKFSGSLKDPGYIKRAWRAYSGNNSAKAEIAWYIEHGIEKLGREQGKEMKDL